ncbi:transglycosylase SLT domain-containing protein [Burkholderia glumae]|uniref:lytic transglycosylase domain-containing protein n=2 Tax=Burkholderia glumae TaxID=337 RepID=UPI001463A834|nr:transglycosylase SLT domain-containing protein [Burkholderia glumae]QJP69044.1 transglycosylase SLT domain-containing protein [Burkholderia glumae]
MAMRYRKIALRGVAPLCLGALVAIVLGRPGIARADCIDEAAAFQHVNVGLMRAIAQVESGTRTNVINPNSNGTFDIGLMQINSSWLPRLAREGITEQSLFDPCTNAYVGAWILSENIRQFGPTWNAIGAYNASAPDKRLAYARKVYDAAQSIISTADSPMPILPPSFIPPQTYNPFASLEVNQVRLAAPRAANAPAAAPAGAPPSPAISAAAPGQYNFGWDISGAPEVKPVQVFDDGKRIYAQFSDMKRVPAIFADTPHGRAVLRWESQPPYAVISSLEPSLIFQLGGAEAKAQRRPNNAPLPPGMQAAASAAAAAGAAASKSRGAGAVGTDALWYVSTPTTVPGPTKLPNVEAPANSAATFATAQTGPAPAAAPAAPAPARKPAADARNSTSALWYLTK